MEYLLDPPQPAAVPSHLEDTVDEVHTTEIAIEAPAKIKARRVSAREPR